MSVNSKSCRLKLSTHVLPLARPMQSITLCITIAINPHIFSGGSRSLTRPAGRRSAAQPSSKSGNMDAFIAAVDKTPEDPSPSSGIGYPLSGIAATAVRIKTALGVVREHAVLAELSEIAGGLMTKPWRTQMQHLAAMGAGSDVAFSNWTRFPLADMEMGSAGKPFAFRGFITPMLNWVFLALPGGAGPEDGVDIGCHIPASASKSLQAHPLWGLAFPDHSFAS